ncbi:MAG: hypothetical protein HQK53_17135 [Oligoflexia bacterium]|nr:hypothetical protein [Oligoflexia bacterium]
MITSQYRILNRISIGLGLLPMVCVGGVLLFTIRSRSYLGFWPHPSQPDPKLLPFELQHMILWYVLFTLPISLIAIWIIRFLEKKMLQVQRSNFPVIANIAGWVLIVIMIFVPGIDFVGWFID